jgi:large repetitive protein
VKIELGLRHARETTAGSANAAAATTGTSTGAALGTPPAPTTPQADISSVRARLTGPVPGLPGAHLYGELEQDVRSADKRVAALGGDYALADKGRLYLRHEFISSLSGPYALNGAQKQNATVIGLDTDYLPGSHLFTEYRVRDAYSGGDAQAAIGLRNAWVVSPGVRLGSSFERVHTLSGRGTEESTAGSVSIDITTDPDWKGSSRLELRRATSEDSLLSTFGWAYKLDQEWTALLRNAYSLSRHKAAPGGRRLQERAQVGLAYRDTQTNAWHVLSRFEHRIDQDSTQPLLPVRQSSDVVSVSVNHQASQPLVISARLAAKWLLDESSGISSRSATQMLSLRGIYALSERWDAGAQASVMRGTGGSSRHTGLGVEGGYRVASNLWLSAGFNFFGFKDRDLAGSDYTQRGAFVRLRFKFDEDWFVFDSPDTRAGASATSSASSASASAATAPASARAAGSASW